MRHKKSGEEQGSEQETGYSRLHYKPGTTSEYGQLTLEEYQFEENLKNTTQEKQSQSKGWLIRDQEKGVYQHLRRPNNSGDRGAQRGDGGKERYDHYEEEVNQAVVEDKDDEYHDKVMNVPEDI